MDAGPELDKLMAERVMGWCLCRWKNEIGEVGTSWFDKDIEPTLDNVRAFYCPPNLADSTRYGWRPSRKVDAAWQVAEKLAEDGWAMDINHEPYSPYGVLLFRKDRGSFYAQEATFPHAMCLAAKEATDENPTG
jgi:hypothetical protein